MDSEIANFYFAPDDAVSYPAPTDCQQVNADRISLLTNCATEGAMILKIVFRKIVSIYQAADRISMPITSLMSGTNF